MREKIFKIWENACKVCAHHFGHLEARWKKNSTIDIVDVHPYKNILLPRYTVQQKTVKFVEIVSKTVSEQCHHLCCGALYREWFVVVHFCSNISLSRQMTPLQIIKFQTADFPIFFAHVILIFWTTCVFSLVVMGSGKQFLPVFQCLKRGIAFVSSFSLI